MNNSRSKASGITLAMAVASLVGGCAANTTDSSSASANAMKAKGTTDLAHCYDVNICKGHNDCGGKANSCAGQASCKGTGFVGMPSKACGDVGGKVKDKWRGTISTAELAHCHGVNICKGHNDCKGASNSCAGQAKCNGQGFVAMPAKACGDIGGKVS